MRIHKGNFNLSDIVGQIVANNHFHKIWNYEYKGNNSLSFENAILAPFYVGKKIIKSIYIKFIAGNFANNYLMEFAIYSSKYHFNYLCYYPHLRIYYNQFIMNNNVLHGYLNDVNCYLKDEIFFIALKGNNNMVLSCLNFDYNEDWAIGNYFSRTYSFSGSLDYNVYNKNIVLSTFVFPYIVFEFK